MKRLHVPKVSNGKRKFALIWPGFILALSLSSALYAKDPIFKEADETLQSIEMDIHGVFKKKDAKTKSNKRIAGLRKKLEAETEEKIKKQVADIRANEENKLTEKLQKALADGKIGPVNGSSTTTGSTATNTVITKQVVLRQDALTDDNNNKITLGLGIVNYLETNSNLESNQSYNLAFETRLSNRFAIGVAGNYTVMELTDKANTFLNGFAGTADIYSLYYTPDYYSTFGNQGRKMDYTSFQLQINAKFYVIYKTKVRVFVTGGVTYGRANLSYDDDGIINQQQNSFTNNSLYSINNINFGDEEFDTNFFNGNVAIGTEILFAHNIGVALDLDYSKSFTNSFGSTSRGSQYNPDRIKLENVANSIIDSHILSIKIGLMATF